MAGNEVKTEISKKLSENIQYLNERLAIGEKNFDIILKEIVIGGKKAALLFIDGFTSNDISTLILQTILSVRREDIFPGILDKLLHHLIPYVEVTPINDLEEAIRETLAGPMLLLVDGERQGLLIDIRQYPARSPQEPDIERITRGSRDGFVETLVFNISLIRRRIRDPKLRVEAIKAGRRSVTDVAIMYIEDIAHPGIVENVRSRIKNIQVDALPMAEKSVEEFITESNWNIFPLVRYTERPDVAAVHLYEGHVLVLVDTSPAVMILPATFFHHLQHAEEYRQNVFTGIYIRWVRFLAVFISVFLAPLYLLVSQQPELLPEALSFIGPKKVGAVPLFVQFIIVHFGIDLIRIAGIHTSAPLATSLGLIAAILIGQIAIDVGIFTPEVLLYGGMVAVGMFATPSWELSQANRIVHLFLLLLTGLFKLPGFIISIAVVILRLVTGKSFGVPYLWPLLPFNGRGFVNVLLRRPLPHRGRRPEILKTKDSDRTEEGG